MMRIGGIGAAAILWLAVGLLAACGGASGSAKGTPDFTVTTFDGQRLALRELAGRPVVLNFWASWCGPCRTEMPLFEAASRATGGGVVFVGLATKDDAESARAFLRELGVSYANALDEGNRIANHYQVVGLPVTVFIGRDGTVARRWTGALSEQQLAEFVAEIAR